MAVSEMIADRLEGKPVQTHHVRSKRVTNFVFTDTPGETPPTPGPGRGGGSDAIEGGLVPL